MHGVRIEATALKAIQAEMNGGTYTASKAPSNGWQGKGDPMEERTERWLTSNGIRYRRDDLSVSGTQLDFYLIDFDVYIEVKRFHTDRIAKQMARAKNVIAVQGMESLAFLEHLVNWRVLRNSNPTNSSYSAKEE